MNFLCEEFLVSIIINRITLYYKLKLNYKSTFLCSILLLTAELIFDYCDNMNMPPELYESYRTTLVLLQYFLPLIVISYAYARVALTLWGSTAPGNAQSDRDSNIMRNKKKVLKVSWSHISHNFDKQLWIFPM